MKSVTLSVPKCLSYILGPGRILKIFLLYQFGSAMKSCLRKSSNFSRKGVFPAIELAIERLTVYWRLFVVVRVLLITPPRRIIGARKIYSAFYAKRKAIHATVEVARVYCVSVTVTLLLTSFRESNLYFKLRIGTGCLQIFFRMRAMIFFQKFVYRLICLCGVQERICVILEFGWTFIVMNLLMP